MLFFFAALKATVTTPILMKVRQKLSHTDIQTAINKNSLNDSLSQIMGYFWLFFAFSAWQQLMRQTKANNAAFLGKINNLCQGDIGGPNYKPF